MENTTNLSSQKNVYFIYGTQTFEIEEKKKELREKIEQQTPNYEYYKYRITDLYQTSDNPSLTMIEEIKNTCEMVSFFSHKIFIDIYDLQEFILKQKPQTKNIEEFLLQYIQNPPPDIIFCLSANIKKTTELKSSIKKMLEKHATIIKTTITYDDFKPTRWLLQKARQKELFLDQEVAELLIELAGNELTTLDMELEKLSLQFGNQEKITAEILIKSISHTKATTLFRMMQFLSKRDLKNTLESLNLILLSKNTDSIALYGFIASQFRKLLKIKYLVQTGYSNQEIVQKLKMNPWIVKESIKISQIFSILELENIIIYLGNSDLQFKFFHKEDPTFLKTVCFKICQGYFNCNKSLQKKWIPEIL